MKITNKQGFPDALVRAVEADPYSRGASDYSVTQLLKPPRAVALELVHKASLEDDVEDRLWSLYGQIAHTILERANEADLVEKRYFAEFAGKKVSGQVDTLSIESRTLSDWKFTTSWGFKLGQPPKPEWVAQLNMQREIILRQPNPPEVNQLQIIGLLRDWSKLEARRSEDYPKKGVQVVSIPVWSREQTTAFIEERISMHEAAKAAASDADLPLCSTEDRWAKQDAWAVMRGERAIRFGVCFTEDGAKQLHANNPGTRIEFRPGQSVRCEAYCSVSDYCTQHQAQNQRRG